MGITYEFKCDKCENETYLVAENEYEKVLICEECAECYTVEQKKLRPESNIPKCLTCQSTNIQKMGAMESGASIVGLGIFSNKINKMFKCKNCGYMW